MSKKSRKELLEVTRNHYQDASWSERKSILDSFTSVTGHNRKYATTLLNQKPLKLVRERKRKRFYDEEVVEALISVWKAANRIASKRLIPFLPTLIKKLKQHNHISLTKETEEKLLKMSPATVDRLLKAERKKYGRSKSTTRPGRLLKKQIEVRTFSDWNEATPGFFEADLVSHCGGITRGPFLHSLTMTDIFSGWIEMLPVPNKSEQAVLSAIRKGADQAPVRIKGLDTDNGWEFINYSTINWCKREGVTFTRAREYKKNDQAHVEEKNGSVVRRLVGYDRFSGLESLKKMTDLYSVARLYINFFQPSMKLIYKERDGGKVQKKYDRAQTPFERLLGSNLPDEVKQKLQKQFDKLDPVALLQEMETRQISLWSSAVLPNPSKIAEESFASVLQKASEHDYLENVVAKARDHKIGLRARLRITLAESPPSDLPGGKYGATSAVREYIQSLPSGHTFRYQDLKAFADSGICSRVLREMVEEEQLRWLSRGLYQTLGDAEARPIVELTGKPCRDIKAFISALPPGTTFMREELLQFAPRTTLNTMLTRLKKEKEIIHVARHCYRTLGDGNNGYLKLVEATTTE